MSLPGTAPSRHTSASCAHCTVRSAGRSSTSPRATIATTWSTVVDRQDLANEEVDAVLAGWGRADQRDLTRRFEEPWLDGLTTWWEQRSIEMARRLVRGLFPPARDARHDVAATSHPTVIAVDDWLADHADAPAALRRLVVEERDHLLRGLRAQTDDATT